VNDLPLGKIHEWNFFSADFDLEGPKVVDFLPLLWNWIWHTKLLVDEAFG
jgi:hypothetical protein